jgi:hypothetical protein
MKPTMSDRTQVGEVGHPMTLTVSARVGNPGGLDSRGGNEHDQV